MPTFLYITEIVYCLSYKMVICCLSLSPATQALVFVGDALHSPARPYLPNASADERICLVHTGLTRPLPVEGDVIGSPVLF